MTEAQAVFATRRGGPGVLAVRTITIPQPGAGEVVVRIRAAGVAVGDTLLRRGLTGVRLPAIPGYDAAGTVQATGPDVTGLTVGTPVAVWAGAGGYTTHLKVPAWAAVPYPPRLDPGTVAAMLLNYLTAYQMLHRATRLDIGAAVLIHPAAGQVGQALLQLGALQGLRMFGTANNSKLHLVAAAGAEPIDYRNDDYARRLAGQLDAVFDGIGGNSWRTSRPAQTRRKPRRLRRLRGYPQSCRHRAFRAPHTPLQLPHSAQTQHRRHRLHHRGIHRRSHRLVPRRRHHTAQPA